MFSYRHAYHAGNHADVLKHLTLLCVLDYLRQKDTPLAAVDTHAGVGLYSLAAAQARTSAEADEGIARLEQWLTAQDADTVAPAIARYTSALAHMRGLLGNAAAYPGSPLWLQQGLRLSLGDKLHLIEMNPRDARLLRETMEALAGAAKGASRNTHIQQGDGFSALKALLPPPARRALVLLDPSYELKTDYAQVVSTVQDALVRFATGVYAVWYPIVGRAEAHELPRRLKKLAEAAGRSWLDVRLNVGSPDERSAPVVRTQRTHTGRHVIKPQTTHTGLRESGMFLVNPPFTLFDQLHAALPQLKAALAQGSSAAFTLEAGGDA